MLNKHKVTKTLSNSPWCKDTKVLAEESLCLQFSGVALRAFVSLCLIVLWFFIVDFVELKLLRFAQTQAVVVKYNTVSSSLTDDRVSALSLTVFVRRRCSGCH